MMTISFPHHRQIITSALLAVLLFSGFIGITSTKVQAASAPNILSYQGRLLNANGVPVSDTTANMTFMLSIVASEVTQGDAECLWSNSSSSCATGSTRTVTLTDGLFSENLGDTTIVSPYSAIPDTVFANNATIYLQVTVNGEVLSPAKRLTATPYALNADSIDGYDSTQVGGTAAAALVLDATGNLQLTGNPDGSTIGKGSLYINPATGDVSANDMLFGIAVSDVAKFSLDAEGDSVITGDLATNGGDITTSASTFNLLTTTATTLSFASAATSLKINDAAGVLTKTINLGGVTGNSPDAINIATEGTQADTIIIGNNNAATLFTLTGGNDWSLDSAGLFTTAGNIAVNGGGVSSTAALALSSSAADISLSPNGASAGLVYVTSGDSFVVGNTTVTAPFVVTADTNVMRLGDGVNDSNDPTINFYSSNNSSSSGALSYIDSDAFNFAGGGFVVNSINTTSDTSQSFLDNTVTTGDGMVIEVAALTDGNGLIVKRTDGATNFTGSLMDVQQLDIDPASTGVALRVTQNADNSGCVASPCARGLFIAQAHTTGHITNDSGGSALAIDVNETGSSDDAIVLRAGASTTFRVTTAGDAYADGAFTGAGADLAEYFTSTDAALSGGEVVCQDASGGNNSVRQCAAGEINPIGVVSTNPAFIGNIIGDGSEDLRHNSKYRLVGLLGQIDTIVDDSGGAINIGDAITSSSTTSGRGAKTTSAGRIIGYALEPLTSSTGSIRVLVQPQWFGGSTTAVPVSTTPAEVIAANPVAIADNSVSAVTNTSILDIDGSLNMNGGRILSISSLQGIGGNWHLAENGDFTTHGQFIGLVNGYSGAPVETYATMSQQHLIQLSGTSTLHNGIAHIIFSEVDAKFADIIDNTSPYRVIATPSGLTGQIYISERDTTGFTIRDISNASGVLVDWLVMANNKDFATVSPEPASEPIITPAASESIQNSSDSAVSEPIIETDQSELPTEPPVIVEEPLSELPTETAIDATIIAEPVVTSIPDTAVSVEPAYIPEPIIETPIVIVSSEPVTP